MMKGVLYKGTSVITIIFFCLSCFFVPVRAVENNTGEKSFLEITSKSIDKTAVNSISEVTDYATYYNAVSSLSNADSDIKLTLNKNITKEGSSFTVEVPSDGLYTFGMSYKALNPENSSVEVSLKIDDKVPFKEAQELSFPCIWMDNGDIRTDGNGNQFFAEQILYNDFYFGLATDINKKSVTPYSFYLSKGVHNISITTDADFVLEYVAFNAPRKSNSYSAPQSKNYYSGAPITIEGEQAFVKTSRSLSAMSDNTSVKVTPHSINNTVVNYIGGNNWSSVGDAIVWETPELSEGYYQLAFSFQQSTVLGGKCYRKLMIDGEVPFTEAEEIGFSYGDDWQKVYFQDDEQIPYLIYLSEGKHKISLTVVPGEMEKVYSILSSAVTQLSSLYLDMTMITGETVDTYRDYDLFSQIPDMKQRLENINEILKKSSELLVEITGQKSGSHVSTINNMSRVVTQMLENRYTAHRYISSYYDRYTAIASVLYEMQEMPLSIDKISLTAPGEKTPFTKSKFLEQTFFTISRFIVSFINDYNNISDVSDENKFVTIWVAWGQDQARILNSLAQSTFTSETGIPVNVQLVNASIVQAVLSGKGPDVILQHSRSEPVNLAMRGVLYDLSQFEDLDNVLSRFQKGADIPYRYKNGLYALPDTQTFFVMFYRKDILNQLGLSLPNTWEEFSEIVNLLARRNLTAWLPNNPVSSVGEANAGIGSINIFPSLLLQNGISLYSDNGKKTNLKDPNTMLIFTEWADYYKKMQLPESLNFYNRFRTGTCPIGINVYNLYATLKAAAPEIDGLWGVAPIPGTVNENGEIVHTSSGGGTACAILKSSKNPQNAWSFIKWWTEAGTQNSFSSEMESILGDAGRVAVSNIEAFKKLEWDSEILESMLSAWEQVEEIPEYPGSYYVSRSVYQAFWNVIENNENAKDMLLKYGQQADDEILRKWNQYENRGQ